MKRLLLSTIFASLSIASFSNIVYVKLAATGNNDGTSWVDAYTNPITAITSASAGDSIFMSTLTIYTNSSIAIPTNVSIFGGFPETGNPTWTDRDWEANPVIFSGDFNQDDIFGNFSTRSDNATRVFTTNTMYEINGIIIANGGNNTGGTGCGLAQGGATSREGIIKNCVFKANYSTNGGALSGQGGAVRGVSLSINDTLIIENTLFVDNRALEGGAVYSQGTLIMDNCKVVQNRASRGAALCANNSLFDSHIVANNILFLENTQEAVVAAEGGAVLHIFTDFTNNGILSEFTNCSFVSNHATQGTLKADLLSIYGGGSSSFTDTYYLNCLFYSPNYNNSVHDVFNTSNVANYEFINCMTDLDSVDFCGSLIPGSNSDIDFNYVQTPIWAIEDNTTDYIYQLDCNSPGINEGDDMNYNGFSTDVQGNERSSGPSIDLGAFETPFTPVPVIVNSSGTLSTTISFDNYQWNLNGSPISGANNSTYTTTQDGDYTVTATNNNECVSAVFSNVITIGGGTGAELTTNSKINITLYPNPTNGEIFIQTTEKVNLIQISDMNGRLLLIATNADDLDLSTFENGIYLVQVETENGTFAERVIKR